MRLLQSLPHLKNIPSSACIPYLFGIALQTSAMVVTGPIWSFGLPALAGFNVVWFGAFDGHAGQSVDPAQWNIITKYSPPPRLPKPCCTDTLSHPHSPSVHYNNEVQEYTTSTDNLQISGNGALQIIPRKSASGQWTSARIESKAAYTAEAGKTTRFQALLRFGDTLREKQQGVWPAFWMLGESSRQGMPWPECGELDIMERINGDARGHGTLHCGLGDVPCGAMTESVPLPDNGWHTWALEIDRSVADWNAQSVSWFLDDNKYSVVKGSDVKDEGIWEALAQSPMYFILNVAVGGNWCVCLFANLLSDPLSGKGDDFRTDTEQTHRPGNPNNQTADGLSSMMEVMYIAVYSK